MKNLFKYMDITIAEPIKSVLDPENKMSMKECL